MRQLSSLTIAAMLLTFASSSYAGVVAKQAMESKVGGKTVVTRHTWWIDGDKFHLAVNQGAAETKYIFNGKTFYVCGKLDESQMQNVGSDKKLLEPFRQGACQVVPSNFMVRFFLSPQLAVESVDASDGMKLTLAVKDYKLTPPEAKAVSVAGRSCQRSTRSYDVTKTGETAVLGAAAEETLCQANDVKWRGGVGREVAKTVLRQPGGATLTKLLKGDQDMLPGLVLDAQIRQVHKDREGKRHEGSYHLTTTSLIETAVSPDQFKLPDGYRLFSIEGLDLAKLGGPKASPGKAAKEDSVIDMFQSAFFCAIAGRLGCFAN